MSDGGQVELPTVRPRHFKHHRGSAHKALQFPQGASNNSEEKMNTIIYIVGLVVIIGFILSYFGFR